MKKKHRKFRIFFKVQLILFLLVAAGTAYYFLSGYAGEIKELKAEAERFVRASTPADFQQNQISVVYAADGSVISVLNGEKKSYYLSIGDMPKTLVDAITTIEDKRFFTHGGVDYKALLRAFKVMLENGGKATQGGSTITMQLARTMFLNQEKTWQRKLEEIFIAWELEKKYTKDQILEFYLNNIYYGHGYYGVLSACRGFFNREISELSLAQIAFLCAVPNNPTYYDPVEHMDHAVTRRNRVLDQMQEDGKITQELCMAAKAEPVVLEQAGGYEKNDYVETFAYYCATRALMEQEGFVFQYQFASPKERQDYDGRYGEAYAACQKKLYTGGYHIYTSLQLGLQEKLQSAVNGTLEDFSAVNEEGIYQLQSAAVCIDNRTGYVAAIVGGRAQEYPGYTLNRAYQSYRQPGSAIKPLLVYTPAMERSYTPESVVVDEPVEDGPKNANGTYLGEMTLREAIERSVNTIAWKLYDEITPTVGLSYLQKMNFAKLDAEDYRLATSLGGFTNGVSALEMAAGFAAIEHDGKYRTPTCILRIDDADGIPVFQSAQTETEVYKMNAARMMTDALRGVLTAGTGKGLDLGEIPAAGKTGTTNNQKDGWFVGYTRYYTTSVWVGYDMPKKLEHLAGSTYPGKIWQTFMLQAHEGLEIVDFLPYVKVSKEHQGGREFEGEPSSELWQIERDSESAMQPEGDQPNGGNEPYGGGQPNGGNEPSGGGQAGGNQPGGNGQPSGGGQSEGSQPGENGQPNGGGQAGGNQSGENGQPSGGGQPGGNGPSGGSQSGGNEPGGSQPGGNGPNGGSQPGGNGPNGGSQPPGQSETAGGTINEDGELIEDIPPLEM